MPKYATSSKKGRIKRIKFEDTDTFFLIQRISMRKHQELVSSVTKVEYRRNQREERLDTAELLWTLLRECLKGWENFIDEESGEPIEFSEGIIEEYITDVYTQFILKHAGVPGFTQGADTILVPSTNGHSQREVTTLEEQIKN